MTKSDQDAHQVRDQDAHQVRDHAQARPLGLEQARKLFSAIMVIYERPADYPSGYVVRTWYGLDPEPDAFRCDDLETARAHCIAAGCAWFMPRALSDAPCIREVWI
jgi:hypothetical protein